MLLLQLDVQPPVISLLGSPLLVANCSSLLTPLLFTHRLIRKPPSFYSLYPARDKHDVIPPSLSLGTFILSLSYMSQYHMLHVACAGNLEGWLVFKRNCLSTATPDVRFEDNINDSMQWTMLFGVYYRHNGTFQANLLKAFW